MQFLACAHGRSLAKAAQQKLYKQLSYPCKFQKCHCANASVSFGCFCLRTPGKFQGCVLNVSEFFGFSWQWRCSCHNTSHMPAIDRARMHPGRLVLGITQHWLHYPLRPLHP